LLLRLARDAREVEALGSVLSERSGYTPGVRCASVDTLVEVVTTSSLAETSLLEQKGSSAISDIGLDLELNAIDFRRGSVGVWKRD